MKTTTNTSLDSKPHNRILKIHQRFNKEELFINCASFRAGIKMNIPYTYMYIRGHEICSNWTELMTEITQVPKHQKFSLIRELITQLKPM